VRLHHQAGEQRAQQSPHVLQGQSPRSHATLQKDVIALEAGVRELATQMAVLRVAVDTRLAEAKRSLDVRIVQAVNEQVVVLQDSLLALFEAYAGRCDRCSSASEGALASYCDDAGRFGVLGRIGAPRAKTRGLTEDAHAGCREAEEGRAVECRAEAQCVDKQGLQVKEITSEDLAARHWICDELSQWQKEMSGKLAAEQQQVWEHLQQSQAEWGQMHDECSRNSRHFTESLVRAVHDELHDDAVESRRATCSVHQINDVPGWPLRTSDSSHNLTFRDPSTRDSEQRLIGHAAERTFWEQLGLTEESLVEELRMVQLKWDVRLSGEAAAMESLVAMTRAVEEKCVAGQQALERQAVEFLGTVHECLTEQRAQRDSAQELRKGVGRFEQDASGVLEQLRYDVARSLVNIGGDVADMCDSPKAGWLSEIHERLSEHHRYFAKELDVSERRLTEQFRREILEAVRLSGEREVTVRKLRAGTRFDRVATANEAEAAAAEATAASATAVRAEMANAELFAEVGHLRERLASVDAMMLFFRSEVAPDALWAIVERDVAKYVEAWTSDQLARLRKGWGSEVEQRLEYVEKCLQALYAKVGLPMRRALPSPRQTPRKATPGQTPRRML